MGIISRAMKHRSVESEDTDELKTASKNAGCELISLQADRSIVTIHGVLKSVTFCPLDARPSLEAEICDGSDSVTIVWIGRRHLMGIAPGKTLKITGRMGMRRGLHVIYNPRYELDA